jgi:T4 RnlA family RNA ligase
MIKINKILPTYEQALEIVANHDIIFYETKHVVNGFDVSIFNYRLAWYTDFALPVPSNPSLDAFEMRGLTVVFNKDGSVFDRFLLLDKFFNVNQVEETEYKRINSFEIDNVYSKEDGSIISFVKLPDGTNVAKSKASFESFQAVKANEIYNSNNTIKTFVDDMMSKDIVPVFEYVSPFNPVVLKYVGDELILLRLRDNKTGKYIDIDKYAVDYGVKVPNKWDITLEVLMERAKVDEDMEGWVVMFKNGLLAKIKTDWYFDLHRLYTEDLNQEHYLIAKIVNEEVDDIISKLEDNEHHNFIKEKIGKISEVISIHINEREDEVMALRRVYIEMDDIAKFAKTYIKDKSFPIVMNLSKVDKFMELSNEEILDHYGSKEIFMRKLDTLKLENQIKNHILDKTNKMMKAREWLLELDSDMENYIK